MPILDFTPNQTGLAGVFPHVVYLDTNDTLAQVTTTGYLNKLAAENVLLNNAMALVSTKTSPNAIASQVTWLEVSKSGGNWSLIPTGGPGSVTLPTIANHIATYTNTTGGLSEDPATAISAGNIQAGLSGTAGYLASFSSTAARGSLRLAAVANTGNTVTTLSNAAMGQASQINIPDPANAIGQLLIGATATPFTTGHIAVASGTSGLMGQDAATAINGGNIQAGLSGTAGYLASFSSTAARGSLRVAAVANTGNTVTTLSNAAMGQASQINIPDPGNAIGQLLIAAGATPFTNKHLPIASGTGGLIVDSGAQLLTGTSPTYAGGGTSNAFSITGLSSAASGACVIRTSTNSVTIDKAVPGTDSLTVTFSADPGANTTVDYFYSTAALS